MNKLVKLLVWERELGAGADSRSDLFRVDRCVGIGVGEDVRDFERKMRPRVPKRLDFLNLT